MRCAFCGRTEGHKSTPATGWDWTAFIAGRAHTCSTPCREKYCARATNGGHELGADGVCKTCDRQIRRRAA
jgi:hypothetical protein